MSKLRFYEVNDSYIEYCRNFDCKVPDNKIGSRKHARKFIGIVLEIGNYKYFAPLSSYKPKHNTMSEGVDFIKIKDNDGGYAVINLNNMIPVPDDAIIEIDIDNEPDFKYRNLLLKQFLICKSKKDVILRKANKLYEIVTVNKTQRFVMRCCDFKLLESKCEAVIHQSESNSLVIQQTAASSASDSETS